MCYVLTKQFTTLQCFGCRFSIYQAPRSVWRALEARSDTVEVVNHLARTPPTVLMMASLQHLSVPPINNPCITVNYIIWTKNHKWKLKTFSILTLCLFLKPSIILINVIFSYSYSLISTFRCFYGIVLIISCSMFPNATFKHWRCDDYDNNFARI